LSELKQLENCGLAGCMSENPGISYAIHAEAPRMPLLGGGGLNIFNHRTAGTLSPAYSLFILSPELSRDEIRDLIPACWNDGSVPGSCAIIVQGTCETMITQDCMFRLVQSCGRTNAGTPGRQIPAGLWIRDDTGRIYPVTPDGTCRTHIGNSSDTCLVEYLPALSEMGITDLILDARNRSPTYTETITRIYREAIRISGSAAGLVRDAGLKKLKREIVEITAGTASPGHFLQGLRDS